MSAHLTNYNALLTHNKGVNAVAEILDVTPEAVETLPG